MTITFDCSSVLTNLQGLVHSLSQRPIPHSCEAWLPYGWMAVTGLLITQPYELRSGRWIKIAASMGILYFCQMALDVKITPGDFNPMNFAAFGGHFLLVAILTCIWAGTICGIISAFLFRILDDPEEDSGAAEVNLGEAYRAIHKDDFTSALTVVKGKLRKEPKHYVGLLLATRLNFQLGNKRKALHTAHKILRNRHLTDGQREYAQSLIYALKAA